MFAVPVEDVRTACLNAIEQQDDEEFADQLRELLNEIMRHQVQVRQ